jgi:hypothetical protein
MSSGLASFNVITLIFFWGREQMVEPNVFQKMKKACPSKIVARSVNRLFTRGEVPPSKMVNLDSKGEGPAII